MKIFSIIISLFILSSFQSFAQEDKVIKLDLETSIAIAKEQSFTMQRLRESLKGAGYQLNAATSSFKTKITLDLVAPEYDERITSYQDASGLTYFSDKQLSYSANLTINQPLPTDGRLFISSGVFNTDDYDQDEQLTRTTTRIGLSQPIQSLYMYNDIKTQFKKAKMNYDLTSKRLKRNELNVIYNVSSAFYTLNQSKERMSIAEKSLKRLQEAYDIAQNKYNAGLIREVEALQVEVDLGDAKNKYDLSQVEYEKNLNFFKQTLGLSLDQKVELISDFNYVPVNVNLRKAIDQGLKNRLELKEKQIQIEMANLDIKRTKAQGVISGNINAYYDFVGVTQTDIDIHLEDAIKDSWKNLKDRPANFGVGLKLKIPILDWGQNRSRVRAAQTSINETMISLEEETMTIEREIISIVNDLNSSLRRLQLLDKNVDVAEKSFAISQSRFSNGDIDSQALALDRERLDNAHISHLQAYISYKLNLANLMRKTFYDFEKDKEIIY
ncbi:TolC family protein [Puteibacter caeruleilacunae]|nr:TolC family protein [Puteibacter caeruleilacunae]